MIKCKKCREEFNNNLLPQQMWLHGHHNPPIFMMEKWRGEIIDLCAGCHRKLHDEIIKILQKYSTQLKKRKSEYWTWNHIIPTQREKCVEEIIKFTNKWLRGENDSNTTKKPNI